jgi:ubiquinone/menaquinone biosynthesis C-methylase UbiE
MSNQDSLTKEEAIKANIYVHSFLANAGEYNKSPHFRPENQEKVRGILLRLTENKCERNNTKAIDFGCGTGFMIHLMRDLFTEVHGIDITHDMLKQVDLSSGNVYLHESLAENTPFESGTFDFATAYSFMDHLFNYKDFLSEAYRVLKPGGIFYSDLNPNRDFIIAIDNVEKASKQQSNISPIVTREVQGALHNGAYYEQQFGMDGNLLEKAEPIKSLDKGFNYQEVISTAQEIGFTQCKVEYEWFLGQAKVMHEQSKEASEIVENYLISVLPVSSHLFKYLRFVFIK